jgi:(p)ppGpp synthase/HD superfamily hydrolase
MALLEKAREIADFAHQPQLRKLSGHPYIVHPDRVVAKVKLLPGTDEVDWAAAQLHDVPEDVAEAWDKDRDGFIEPPQELRQFFKDRGVRIPDRVSRDGFTNLWRELIAIQCSGQVLELVSELTYPTEGPEWKHKSRAEKNAIRYEHTAQMSDRAKRIKMVDRWDNCRDMIGANKGWVAKYIPESYKIHSICSYVDADLAKELKEAIIALEKYAQGA